MSNPTREELLALALGVLPELPGVVDVLSEDGGSYELRLSHVEGKVLHGFCARPTMPRDLHLLARVFDPARGRYEVEFEVMDSFFFTGGETLAHLAVGAPPPQGPPRLAARPGLAQAGRERGATAYCCPAIRGSRCAWWTSPAPASRSSRSASSPRATCSR